VDKHDNDAGARFIFLEEKIEQFIDIIHILSKDMEEMKKQQQALIDLIKNVKEK
jgi:FtsZ-binding cell division protein ZapB